MKEARDKTTVLITGATGFVGKQLVQQISEQQQFIVRLAVRPLHAENFNHHDNIVWFQELSATTDWTAALTKCDVVIHTAARVHVMVEKTDDPLSEFRKVNVAGTMNLARQAVQQGVKRFIFISSIGVNGAETRPGSAFRPEDPPDPHDPYAVSKFEAEQGLMALSVETDIQIVIIRPTLIYGPGAKGNFPRMVSWLQKGYPLPLKSINNKRSLVSVYNLVDLVIHCIDHPRAVNQIFLVSDGQDVSIVKLLQYIGLALNKRVRLIPIPYWVLNVFGKMTGTQRIIQRLCSSLQVDMSKTRDLLDWHPQVSMDDALDRSLRNVDKKTC